jgi:hypothetical protein
VDLALLGSGIGINTLRCLHGATKLLTLSCQFFHHRLILISARSLLCCCGDSLVSAAALCSQLGLQAPDFILVLALQDLKFFLVLAARCTGCGRSLVKARLSAQTPAHGSGYRPLVMLWRLIWARDILTTLFLDRPHVPSREPSRNLFALFVAAPPSRIVLFQHVDKLTLSKPQLTGLQLPSWLEVAYYLCPDCICNRVVLPSCNSPCRRSIQSGHQANNSSVAARCSAIGTPQLPATQEGSWQRAGRQ